MAEMMRNPMIQRMMQDMMQDPNMINQVIFFLNRLSCLSSFVVKLFYVMSCYLTLSYDLLCYVML